MTIYFEDPQEFKIMLDKINVSHSKNCSYNNKSHNNLPNCDCWVHEIRKSFSIIQRMIDEDKK